jgi:hypothetical protein
MSEESKSPTVAELEADTQADFDAMMASKADFDHLMTMQAEKDASKAAAAALDPVCGLASRMVDAATPDDDERLTAKGAVIILTVAGSWAKSVAVAWRRGVCGEPIHVAAKRRWGGSRDEDEGDGYPLTLLSHDEDDDRSGRRKTSEIVISDGVRTALRNGRGLLLVVIDLSEVPAGLQAAADVVVEIPLPTATLVREVIGVFCAGEVPEIAEETARAVTPDVLLTAMRPGQAAADYVARLTKMVAASRPVPVAAKWTVDTLPMPAEVEKFCRQLMADMPLYMASKLSWADMPRGALLYGPPGTGKTTLSAALAASLGIPIFLGSYSIWESGEDGRGNYTEIIKRMKTTFREALASAPCIIFIDEIDSFMKRSDGTHTDHNESWFRPLMNALLSLMDSCAGRPGVIVLAATNLPGAIDRALARSGRLDISLSMSLPDEAMLAKILSAHTGLAASDLSGAATAFLGASGADCERIARDARRTARMAGRDVTVSDLPEAIKGPKDTRPPEIKYRTAIHEAGHAILCLLQNPGSLKCVSIRENADAGGGTTATNLPTGHSTASDIDALLRTLLAGRAAEELVLNSASAGSGGPEHSDLARATLIAASAEVSWGLSASGISWRGDVSYDRLPTMLGLNRDVAARVEQRLADALEGAKDLLWRHRAELDALVSALISREVLSGAEAAAVVAQARTPAPRVVGSRREISP